MTKWQEKRKEIGIPFDAFLLVSVGELNINKNHSVVIKALGLMKDKTIHYIIAGSGFMKEKLKDLARTEGVGEQVHLLGYRSDIADIYKVADACIFPSIREGLGLAAIEGMASGLPLIVADNRGTRDFIDSNNGIICRYYDEKQFSNAIEKIKCEIDIKTIMHKNVMKSKKFDERIVMDKMMEIYKS